MEKTYSAAQDSGSNVKPAEAEKVSLTTYLPLGPDGITPRIANWFKAGK